MSGSPADRARREAISKCNAVHAGVSRGLFFRHLFGNSGRRPLRGRHRRGSRSMGRIWNRLGDIDWCRTRLMRSHLALSRNNRSDWVTSSAR
jgi:hypothetical protein